MYTRQSFPSWEWQKIFKIAILRLRNKIFSLPLSPFVVAKSTSTHSLVLHLWVATIFLEHITLAFVDSKFMALTPSGGKKTV